MKEMNTKLLSILDNFTKSSPKTLPVFDPSRPECAARAWCETAEMCMGEEILEGSALFQALSASMQGEAAVWFVAISYPEMTWTSFKGHILDRFAISETPAAFMFNFLSTSCLNGENYATFAARQVSALTAAWKGKSQEEIIVSTILGNMMRNYPPLRQLVYTTPITTRAGLISALQAVSYGKRKREEDKPAKPFKCFKCGKMGHKARGCRMKLPEGPTKFAVPGRIKGVSCFKCKKLGHYASSCPEKRTNICQIETQMGELKVEWE